MSVHGEAKALLAARATICFCLRLPAHRRQEYDRRATASNIAARANRLQRGRATRPQLVHASSTTLAPAASSTTLAPAAGAGVERGLAGALASIHGIVEIGPDSLKADQICKLASHDVEHVVKEAARPMDEGMLDFFFQQVGSINSARRGWAERTCCCTLLGGTDTSGWPWLALS